MKPGRWKGEQRRIDHKKVAASLRMLEALFGGIKKDNAHGKVGEVGKAENSTATLAQPGHKWQGAQP